MAFQDVLPHIILSPLLSLVYYPPPFRCRGILVLLLVSLAAWRATVSPWPPNTAPTQATRYGLSCAWIHYFPVLERLLLHTPERDFVRNNVSQPAEWSAGKLRWAVELFAAPRLIGWNGRTGEDTRGIPRRLATVLACYVALDGAVLLTGRFDVPAAWAWDSCVRIACLEALMGVIVVSSMTMQYEMAAAVAILLALSRPEDWPPLFGSVTDCSTVGNVWGKGWHQYLRQPCLGISRTIIALLRIPRSTATYAVHLAVAFTFSALFHTLSLAAVRPESVPLDRLVLDMCAFFMLQAVAVVVETILGLRGYLWVLCWFFATGWWLVKGYLDVGMAEWHPPVSLLGWALN